MATIKINRTILDGNLGEGWKCQAAAANAFAKVLEAQWEKDLAAMTAEGHEIEVTVDVASNASGDSGVARIDVAGCSQETAVEVNQRVEYALSDGNRVWERFCNSPEAESLAA